MGHRQSSFSFLPFLEEVAGTGIETTGSIVGAGAEERLDFGGRLAERHVAKDILILNAQERYRR